MQDELREQTVAMARALKVVGLMNVQFAIQNGERDLRARSQSARLAHGAVRVEGDRRAAREDRRALHGRQYAGRRRGVTREVVPPYFSVKEAVFPFIKFPGVDTDPRAGDEIDRRGDGRGRSFGEAFVKSQLAAGVALPAAGKVFISVRDARQAERVVEIARDAGRAAASASSRPAAPRGDLREHGLAVRARQQGGRRAGRTSST